MIITVRDECSFLLSLTHVIVEKVLLLGQIFEKKILMDLQVMRSLESDNPIFRRFVCVYVYLCVRVCDTNCISAISITQKQITDKHLIWYSTFVSLQILLKIVYNDRA